MLHLRPIVLVLSTGCLFCLLTTLSPTYGKPPNILIIVADDLGYSDVGFNGGREIATPNLDRLAETGIVLSDFRACPMCSPTRAGLLTGRWPIRFGMMRAVVPPWSRFGLPAEERTLPELLANAGYEERAIVGKWHLGHARREFLPLFHGFTRFFGHYNGAIDYFTHKREGETDWHDNDRTVHETGYATDILGRRAAQFIREARQPWFLYLPFNAPHSPFQAKQIDLEKYQARKGVRRTYAAMVDSLDQAIGEVLATVETQSDADNTLVLFFSDNGGIPDVGSSNKPYRAGKLTVYEGGTRVCAAIRWPKGDLVGGRRFDERIGYIDVLPTLLHIAGVQVPPNIDGTDILPALRGEKELPARPWFSYMNQNGDAHASVHFGPWKLVAHGDVFGKASEHTDHELYHLPTDIGETTDIAQEHSTVVRRLTQLLHEFGSTQTPGVGLYGEGRKAFVAPRDWEILQ